MSTNFLPLELLDDPNANAINQEMEAESLPPLPDVSPEYAPQELEPFNVKDNSNASLTSYVPLDENGYAVNEKNINVLDLVPYDGEAERTKNLGIWDEAKIKLDMGNIVNYRAKLAHDVWFGNISVEDAKVRTQGRQQEILNKYGITEIPDFSFARFKSDPLRTILGETAQMLPFYGEGLKKGAGYSLITVPAAVAMRGTQGQVAGAVAGTAVEPGGGTAVGAGVGRVGGSVFGVIEGINTGMLLGTFHTSMDVEGMNLYLDLREKGIDDNTAKVAGLSGGLLNGVLEVVSFGVLTAPVKGAAKKVAAKMLWDSMAKSPAAKKMFENAVTYVTKEYFKRMGAEVSTEMLQDVVSNTMTLLAAQADSVESAKPTGEDWLKIITETGPRTAAAMALMGLVSTPFDVMNANVGSIKGGAGEIATKAEIEQNIADLSEGKAVNTGNLTLEGSIQYNTIAEGEHVISELEAELSDSQNRISDMQKTADALSQKAELTADEKTYLGNLRDGIVYEQDYQGLIKEELANASTKLSGQETAQKTRDHRKNELKEKSKKETLSAEEIQELGQIALDEMKDTQEADINEKAQKARERELDKNIRDIDSDIEKARKSEDKAREKRNRVEEKQDKIQKQISDIENENAEIERALEKTDIEGDKAEMQATLTRNKETLKALRNNLKDLETQRSQLNNEIESAIKQEDDLYKRRSTLDEERAGLKEGVIDESGKLDMSVKDYKNQRFSALRKSLKAMAVAVKNGVRLTRREIRDAQNTAIGLIKNSEMPNSDKAKFLTTIRDINSQEKLQKVLPELLRKIGQLEERANKKAALNYMDKLLKQSKPKKGGKTPVGKFNADIQRAIEGIREAVGLTTDEAHTQIEKIFDEANGRDLTDAEVEKVKMLYNFSGLGDKTSRELLPLVRMLKSLIVDGKLAAELTATKKKEHKEKVVSEAKKSIVGDTGEINLDRKKPSFKKVFGQFIKTLGHTSEGWAGLMHVLSQNDKEHTLEKLLDVFPHKMKRIEGVMTYTKKVNEIIKNAFGLKDDKQLLKKCREDSVVEDIGYYTNQDGGSVALQMSRAEARKLYMEMKDLTLENSLKDGNGYTFQNDIENTKTQKEIKDETLEFLFSNANQDRQFSIVDKSTQQLLEEYLTPEDKAFVDAQFEFYKEYRERTNKFYREKFGIDMPANEFYSPIQRRTDEVVEGNSWVNEAMTRMSMKPSSMKARTQTQTSLKPQSDILALADHISQNEHYMAMDGVVTDMDSVFKNNDIRDVIIEKYGDGILRVIDHFITDIKKDGIEAARTELIGFNKFRANITGAYLGLKAQIALKQLTAIGVFANDIPAADFVAGLKDFFANPKKAVDTLSQSWFLKDRADALSIEMRDLVRSNEFNMFSKMKGIKQQMYFFTQWGDKWSIFIGGWAVYQSVMKSTGDHAKAMEAFERASDKYQQSGHIDQLSAWQRSNNPFQKSFVMFTSDQMKQARAEINVIRDAIISRKPDDIIKAAKTVLIMHVILPNLVQLITNGFEWDDNDQLRATILGPFAVYPIMGEILSWGVTQAMRLSGAKIDSYGTLDLLIFRPITEIMKKVEKLKPGDIDGEDVMGILIELTKQTIGPATGLNLKYVIDVKNGIPKYASEGDVTKMGKLFAGWSPYIIDKKGKKSNGGDEEDSGDYGENDDYKEDKE